jgi:CHAT domain-containing protein
VHLPIHAANDGNRGCTGYVVSSYTPTIGALLAARTAYTPVKKQDVKALVAAVSRPYSIQWNDLLSTREEASSVKSVLPAGAIVAIRSSDDSAVFDDHEITSGMLLQKLPEATFLHLACHGHQDPKNALQSGFVMSDEMLTIERLMQIPLPRAFMAFLSACETAKGDKVSF